ncbi:hypothetical protein SDC9_107877 [bioreactor metagenome]|uniref:Uncharacterized protein n=1 Tax=bioreactor metagenome TaxID=1076179 RepID=A0A645BCV6_9ZZZZ
MKLAHYAGEILIDIRVIIYIRLKIGSEDTNIGLSSSVYKNSIIYFVLFIISGYYLFGIFNIIFQIVNSAEFLDHLGSAEFNAGHVYIDRPLNPSAL